MDENVSEIRPHHVYHIVQTLHWPKQDSTFPYLQPEEHYMSGCKHLAICVKISSSVFIYSSLIKVAKYLSYCITSFRKYSETFDKVCDGVCVCIRAQEIWDVPTYSES